MGFLIESIYSQSTCSQLVPNCIICNGGMTGCVNCNTGYFVRPADSACVACSTACAACTSSAGASCTQCKAGNYLSTDGCKSCEFGCLECSSAFVCQNCEVGKYLDSGLCKLCPNGCRLCNATNTCSVCNTSGATWDGSKCAVDRGTSSPTTTNLATGAIAGIAVGSVVCFVIIVVIIVCACRKQQLQKQGEQNTFMGNSGVVHPIQPDGMGVYGLDSPGVPIKLDPYKTDGKAHGTRGQASYSPSPMMMAPSGYGYQEPDPPEVPVFQSEAPKLPPGFDDVR